eukprot:TRINITY_DN55550_c0_g1_i1.p1 TRINITY_DN55550_c0_g1~~TRINITY_DN55550_c0_g1_i1.p1  ORF type:complete len:457 (-),score=184.20 TRINITY_DN55550_c0_g1_i1:88-1458(-)
MELAVNVPAADWYRNSTHNDLEYWGPDYPPLTMMHSWAIGKVAQWVEPDLVELHTSRGLETESSKLFMRWSVIVSDLIFWMPAVLYFVCTFFEHKSPQYQMSVFFAIVNNPGLLLIDHGHFQFNGVSLGLALGALTAILNDRHLLGSVLFVLSVCFKQMALYYAPAFFFYLLSHAVLRHPGGLVAKARRLAEIGGVVLLTFFVCFAPFLRDGETGAFAPVTGVSRVLHRVFPVARGLFEDKVANFWCTSNLIIKWRKIWSNALLFKMSTGLTLLALAPSCMHLLLRPSKRAFRLALCSCAFSFFLFSFQVHEKTILLPLLPSLTFVGAQPQPIALLSAVATFSMYPLLLRDGLVHAYVVLQLSQFWMFASLASDAQRGARISFCGGALRARMSTLVSLSVLGMFAMHAFHALTPAFPRLPHLQTVVITSSSAVFFGIAWLVTIMLQWSTDSKRKQT